jgi:hypothetical protein
MEERRDRTGVAPVVDPVRIEQLAVLATVSRDRLGTGDDGARLVAELCETVYTRAGDADLMLREEHRVEALATMLARGGSGELARIRRAVEPDADTPLQRVLDDVVLQTGRPLDTYDEDELVAALAVERWIEEAAALSGRDTRLRTGLDRDVVESRLARLETTRAVRALVRDGVVGRAAELKVLRAFCSDTSDGAPSLAVVHGVGGVGKSTLIAQLVTDLDEQRLTGPPVPWAYLDLDRPSLSTFTPVTLLEDLVRQLSSQFPELRRSFSTTSDDAIKSNLGAGLEALHGQTTWRPGVHRAVDELLPSGAAPLVVVLDTYESVERSGPDAVRSVREFILSLPSEVTSLRVVVSGRAPAALLEDDPSVLRLHVRPLRGQAAVRALQWFVRRESRRPGAPRTVTRLDPVLAAQVVEVVGGIPLTLRLAARVLVAEGISGVTGAASAARALDLVRDELIRGFLYQRVLNHVHSDDAAVPADVLRDVARAALVLRTVTPGLIDEVLRPAARVEHPVPTHVLVDALTRETSLVRAEHGALRLREEVRIPALAALEAADPGLVRAVHDGAVEYYSREPPSDDDLAELFFHRLSRGEPVAAVSEGLDDRAMDLLVRVAAEVRGPVRRRRGSTRARADVEAERELVRWEYAVVPRVQGAMARHRWEEARDHLAERAERSPASELHVLEALVHEGLGDREAAVQAAERAVVAGARSGSAERFAGAAVLAAALQEKGGDPDRAVVTLLESASASQVAGHPLLRLELLLTAMAAGERAGTHDEDIMWGLELDVRALLQEVGESAVSANTALVRLTAAVLGREEPARLRQAATRLGFGHDEDPERVHDVIAAVSAWGAQQPDPGSFLLAAGMTPLTAQAGSPHDDVAAALEGLGTDAAGALGRLWALGPPEPVREALRQLYLWWGFPHRTRAAADETPVLESEDLDWSRDETRQLEQLVTTAYSTTSELMGLVSRAGLDLSQVSWQGNARTLAREVLHIASSRHKVRDVVRTMLHDEAFAGIRPALQSLVGTGWLGPSAGTATSDAGGGEPGSGDGGAVQAE